MSEFDCNKHNKQDCTVCLDRESNIICSASPEVRQMLNKSKIQNVYKPQQTIFYQGNMPLGLFIVSKGLVKLEFTSADGQAHTLRYISQSGVLGYRSLFAQEEYHATATTLKESEICFIPQIVVMDIFKKHPETALKVMQVLSKDLRLAEAKWTDQMDKEASERIAEALVFLQEHFTHQNWTRREIAEWAGTTPETVIRTLAHFEKMGYIDQSSGRHIKVINKPALSQVLKLAR